MNCNNCNHSFLYDVLWYFWKKSEHRIYFSYQCPKCKTKNKIQVLPKFKSVEGE